MCRRHDLAIGGRWSFLHRNADAAPITKLVSQCSLLDDEMEKVADASTSVEHDRVIMTINSNMSREL